MWIFTKFGFFSVVKKDGDDFLTVRSRVLGDLDNLKKLYLPKLSKIIKNAGTDYPYRAKVAKDDFADGMYKISMDIDYSNFKDEVKILMGNDRANTYGNVWAALFTLEHDNFK